MRRDSARIILRELGSLLLIVSAVDALPLPVAAYTREGRGLAAGLLTATSLATTGLALRRLRPHRAPVARHALIIAALGWLVIPLFSVIPFVMLEGMPFLDAYFEAVSGWTGTGLSLLNPETATETTLWWRTLTQWVGGVGVIVLTITILARPGSAAYALYKGEGRDEKLRPNVVGTARTIWLIYLLYTVLAILALAAIAGLPLREAVHHALTGLSTGGFSVWNTSVSRYDTPRFNLVMSAIMLTGAIAFIAHYALLKGEVRRFLRDVQLRWLLGLTVLGTLATGIALLAILAPQDAARLGAFQLVSALTCTGFQTAPTLSEWPPNAKVLLALAMVIGGSAGSTAGGIKIARAALLAKGVSWKARRASLPAFAVTSFHFGPRNMGEHDANREFAEAAFVTFLWALALLAIIFTLFTIGATFEDATFEAASVVSNVGLSVGLITPALPAAVKTVLILGMWAGRLEIFPVLVLLRNALREE